MMKAASGDARNEVVPAMSCGVARRLSGVLLIEPWAIRSKLSASRPSRVKAEGNSPGAMALTVTLCSASSLAIERVRPTRPALQAT
ncbi:hypothetical protein D3C77_728810 [compost metagenome]